MTEATPTASTPAPLPGSTEANAASVAAFERVQADPNAAPASPPVEPEKTPETPPAAETPKAPEAPKTEPEKTPESAFQAATTEGTKALTDVGLDYAKFAQSYEANGGKLTDADYAEMEAKNIPRSVVDAHIKGLVTAAEAEAAVFRNSVLDVVGGEAKYGELVSWVQGNVPAAEIAAFNAIIDSGSVDAVKFAVAGLNARMTNANGSEPTLVNGTKAPALDVYESTYQMTRDMADPRYAKDPAFRRMVEQKLARSNIM